jgi:hypothetical protein
MKRLSVILALITLTAGIAFAQTMPGWESPQSASTQGRYRGASDNFIIPGAYTGVSFKKFFAMTSFANSGRVQLGYATKIKDLYLAAAYGGSFWANYTPFNFTEKYDADWYGGGKTIQEYKSLDWASGDPENRFALLFGIADMGFRFTLSSTYEKVFIDDFSYQSGYYASYKAGRGAITPQFAWSMAKDLSKNGIRPWATLGLGFIKKYRMYDQYTDTGAAGIYVENSQNYFEPVFDIGLGGYTFYKNDSGFRASMDLDYQLAFQIHKNEYSYTNANGKYQTGIIKGYNDNGNLYEYSLVQNMFTPSVSGQWSGGNVALRFKLNMPVTITNTETTGLAVETASTGGNLVRDGAELNSTKIGFAPNLRLAAQWKILSNFTLNAGGRVTLNAISRQTTKGSNSYTQGVETANTSTIGVVNNFGNTTNQLTAGVTFLPMSNMTLEASCGIGSNNIISVFDPTGLMRFGSLLVSLRF